MGVAGSAPGYTIAVTTGVLLASAGALAPGALVIFAVPMLGIAFAYRALNKRAVSAGAAYQWTTAVFGKLLGFFSGWALLIAALVFMVTGSIPAATASLNFIDPTLDRQCHPHRVGRQPVVRGGGAGPDHGHRDHQQGPGGDDRHRACHPHLRADRRLCACAAGGRGQCVFLVLVRLRLYAAELCRQRAGDGVLLLGLGRHRQSGRGDQECRGHRRQWRFFQRHRHHLLLSGLHHRGAVPVFAEGRQKPHRQYHLQSGGDVGAWDAAAGWRHRWR